MKYWVYLDGKVPGTYSAEELSRLSGVSMTTLLCPAEGEIQDKNWRCAGEFTDVAKALRASNRPPSLPSALGAVSGAGNFSEALDSSETKLFLHVKDLIKEVENSRRSQGLMTSLQKQVEGLKSDLDASLREKADLEKDVSRTEEAGRENHARLEKARAELQEKGGALAELKVEMGKMRSQHDEASTQLKEIREDLSIRNGLVDRLARDLSEKDKNIARLLGIIQKLEEELAHVRPAQKGFPAPQGGRETPSHFPPQFPRSSAAPSLPLPS